MAEHTVLITGASSGFGFSLSNQYAQLGWRVFPTVRDKKAADLLKAIDINRVFPIIADLRDDNSRQVIYDALTNKPIHYTC